MKRWHNYGDVNFTEYGGCLVREDEYSSYCFDVFYLNTEFGEDGDEKFAIMCYVDLTDNWFEWEKVLCFFGCEEYSELSFEEMVKKCNGEVLANMLIEYYGFDDFCSPYIGGRVLTDEELNDILIEIGAIEFI